MIALAMALAKQVSASATMALVANHALIVTVPRIAMDKAPAPMVSVSALRASRVSTAVSRHANRIALEMVFAVKMPCVSVSQALLGKCVRTWTAPTSAVGMVCA